MKANVQYNDFTGTAAADISDFLATKYTGGLKAFGKYFKIDESRFEVVGVSVHGTDKFYVSLVCIDKHKSTADKEHIVSMSIELENPRDILDILFKRLHIVLHAKTDKKYHDLRYDEEVEYENFHELASDEDDN